MTTGRPIATKCPKCIRGKWSKLPVVKGIRRTDETRERVCYGRRRGGVLRTQRRVECLDCGHVWWTTLED